ncbi:fibronectin type III domain-containing protein [Liberiplasma polymorphum]|uniref:fibronectin type III domain-containing protein n=1 Tax=Liberiplasma polymorphum TaxID=3374570 RepID=UPI003775F961
MKKVLLMMILLLLVQGCARESRKELEVPKNLRVEEETLVWDAVEGAEYYTLMLNNITYRVEDNVYSTFNLPNGSYNARVKAHLGEASTIYTNTFTFTINRAFEHPKNVYVSGSTLYWDHTAEASSYKVVINDETVDVLSGRTYNLSGLDENNLYTLSVIAVYENGESNESLSVLYHTHFTVIDTIHISVNKNRSTNVSFPVETMVEFDYIYINNTLVNREMFSFVNNTIVIDYTYLLDLNEALYTYSLLTSEGRVEVMLNVLDERKPYMTSKNTVTYTGEDLTFEFELFGGSFGQLSGLTISSEDYTFENNQLTISAAFIESIKSEDPERSTIILSYDLNNEESSVIGFIFIYLNE